MCCREFSILTPACQVSLVPPVLLTNKHIQCFPKASQSWKTTGFLFFIRESLESHQGHPLGGGSWGKETPARTRYKNLEDSAQQIKGSTAMWPEV